MLQVDFLFKVLKINRLNALFATAKRISQKTGKPLPFILADMLSCIVIHESGYVHYESFRMYEMSKEERRRFLSIGRNNRLCRMLCEKNALKSFDNKLELYRTFSDLLGRDWMELKPDNAEEFARFCTGKTKLIAKPACQFGGFGIQVVQIDCDTDLKELHERLRRDGCDLVENVLEQCPEMAALCSSSVNTVRIVTLLREDGTVVVGSAAQRFGRPGSLIDNFHSGGLAMLADPLSGQVLADAVDFDRNVFERSPETGLILKGFQIPCFEKITALACEAALRVPKMRYIGWDFCVDPEYRPCLIEANGFPGQDITQDVHLNIGTYDAYKKLLR